MGAGKKRFPSSFTNQPSPITDLEYRSALEISR
jgi:hypothetical protein